MSIIDAWVNADMPRNPAAWQKNVAESVFKRSAEDVFRRFSSEELVAAMDEAGVDEAILTLHADRPSKALLEYADKCPGRFAYSAMLDPRRGVTTTRQLEALARAHDLRLARIVPSFYDLPSNDRIYYPIYAKCAELALPISVNTGIPGPLLPGNCQNPAHLDDVCLFFPELTVIMAHGADPWWEIAIALLGKYPNLYLMTSGVAPKRLPESLLRFMGARGSEKVMFASDFPFLTMQRCITQARALGLNDDALEKYLYANAARVLCRLRQTHRVSFEQ